MGKNFWLTSISAMVVACPALAEPFPADGLMQPSMIYENAAIYDNIGVYEGVVEAIPVYEYTSVVCPAGQYLPANASSCATCLADSYCVGGTFEYPIASAQGIASCPAGKVAPIGSSFAGACGKVMHVGEDVLYLTSERQTLPALAAKIDGTVYYAKTTPGAKPMNGTTTKSLRTKIDGIEYSIHDNTAQGE